MKTKVRPIPKGRAVDPKALQDVQALLGDAPRRRDLLIEHLHRVNDRYGYLGAAHLAALAQEMSLALTEVYEVATFYHHFEVVKEGIFRSFSQERKGKYDLNVRLTAGKIELREDAPAAAAEAPLH